MNKVSKGLLVAAVLSAVLVGGVTVMAAGGLPGPDAKAFWTYVTETNPYTGWGYWPGKVGPYKGTRPHGATLVLYANAPALKAAREGTPMPYGAIILKENYGMDGKSLKAVTPMYKVKGYNPDGDDWYWVKYGPDGTAVKEGKVAGCINCHRTRADHDWIFNEAK